jgi:hypothetical protein
MAVVAAEETAKEIEMRRDFDFEDEARKAIRDVRIIRRAIAECRRQPRPETAREIERRRMMIRWATIYTATLEETIRRTG